MALAGRPSQNRSIIPPVSCRSAPEQATASESIELLIGLCDLIGRRLTDEEIASRLELREPWVTAEARRRSDELKHGTP